MNLIDQHNEFCAGQRVTSSIDEARAAVRAALTGTPFDGFTINADTFELPDGCSRTTWTLHVGRSVGHDAIAKGRTFEAALARLREKLDCARAAETAVAS